MDFGKPGEENQAPQERPAEGGGALHRGGSGQDPGSCRRHRPVGLRTTPGPGGGMLLRHAALRISDVALLERSRIQKGELLLHTKKTGGAILLPLPDELLAALEGLPVPRGADPGNARYFFINGTGSARTAISVIERCLRSVFKASGVVNARAHRFRHTMATNILANGGTLADVADVLGISEAVASKHYAKWNQDRQDRIAALMKAMRAGTNRARSKNSSYLPHNKASYWCPGWDLNPHSPYGKRDFKSLASADFATRAWVHSRLFVAKTRFVIWSTSWVPRMAAFVATVDGPTYF